MTRTSSNSVIFIDANAYLSFYQAPSTKDLLKSLLAQRQHVFVTQQIVNEVERNKLAVAQGYFLGLLKSSKLELRLSENLFDPDTQEKLKAGAKGASELYKTLEKAVLQTLDRISKSDDDVSTALARVFADAAECSDDELARAQKRKMFGNTATEIRFHRIPV